MQIGISGWQLLVNIFPRKHSLIQYFWHLQICSRTKLYRLATFPWYHLPNSPWAGIAKLFPPRESLVSDIPAGDGNVANLFLRCCNIRKAQLNISEFLWPNAYYWSYSYCAGGVSAMAGREAAQRSILRVSEPNKTRMGAARPRLIS